MLLPRHVPITSYSKNLCQLRLLQGPRKMLITSHHRGPSNSAPPALLASSCLPPKLLREFSSLRANYVFAPPALGLAKYVSSPLFPVFIPSFVRFLCLTSPYPSAEPKPTYRYPTSTQISSLTDTGISIVRQGYPNVLSAF